MNYIIRFAFFSVMLSALACKTAPKTIATTDDGKIEVVFVQVNDVYKIEPLANGKEGGLARVATLKKQYQQQNPNTFLVMAGDFLSPSVYNSLSYQGTPIRGKQMVEAMNVAGMDLAVFGNHEFDIKETELQARLDESAFRWVASNTFHKQNNQLLPFTKTSAFPPSPLPQSVVLTIKDADGTTAKIGLMGLTLPFNKANYVSYTDPLTTAKEIYQNLKDSVDAVVAITHQSMPEDIKLANELPGLAHILGGHEHDMRQLKVGNTYITKAHANAKSAYVVKVTLDKKGKKVMSLPELKYLNETVSLDSATHQVVQKWTQIADKTYSSMGFEAEKVVLATTQPLDGRETEVRNHPTNLTKLFVAALADAVPQAEVVLMNAGSIRVDDILTQPITQLDILRSLPFGGGVKEVLLKGSLLEKTLTQGRQNADNGGYLLYNEALTYDTNTNIWRLQNKPLDGNKTYRVAITDFLFSGQEANLEFLNPNNPKVIKVFPANTLPDPKADIRLAIIKYLEKKN